MESETKRYDDLTIEEKADFIAERISLGLYDYFDNCEKVGNFYEYYSPNCEEKRYFTPEELVNLAEKESLDELRDLWEGCNSND